MGFIRIFILSCLLVGSFSAQTCLTEVAANFKTLNGKRGFSSNMRTITAFSGAAGKTLTLTKGAYSITSVAGIVNGAATEFSFGSAGMIAITGGDGVYTLSVTGCPNQNYYIEYDRFPGNAEPQIISSLLLTYDQITVRHRQSPSVDFNLGINTTGSYLTPYAVVATKIPAVNITLDFKQGAPNLHTSISEPVFPLGSSVASGHLATFTHPYTGTPAPRKYVLTGEIESYRIPTALSLTGAMTPLPPSVYIVKDVPTLTFDLNIQGALVGDPDLAVLCGNQRTITFLNTTSRDFLTEDTIPISERNTVGGRINEKERWTLCRVADATGTSISPAECVSGPDFDNDIINPSTGVLLTHQLKSFNFTAQVSGVYELKLTYTNDLAMSFESTAPRKLVKKILHLDNPLTDPVDYTPTFNLTGLPDDDQLCLEGNIKVAVTVPATADFTFPSITYPLQHKWKMTGANTDNKSGFFDNFNIKNDFVEMNNRGSSTLKYTLTLNDSSDPGCSVEGTRIIVLPKQTFDIAQDCEADASSRKITASLILPINSFTKKWRINTGSWTNTMPNQVVSFGTVNVDVLSTNTIPANSSDVTCALIDSKSVTVKPNPSLSFSGVTPNICEGENFTLNVNNCSNCESMTNYTWSVNGIAISGSGANNTITAAAVASPVNLVAVTGTYMGGICTFNNPAAIPLLTKPDPIETIITSIAAPTDVDFDWNLGCLMINTPVTFNITSTLTGSPYQWTFAGTPVNTAIGFSTQTHSFATAENHIVTLKATNATNCSATKTKTVVVRGSLVGTINGQGILCSAENANVTLTLPSPAVSPSTVYEWSHNGVVVAGAALQNLNLPITANAANTIENHTLTATATTPAPEACVFTSDTFDIEVLPVPTLTLSGANGCEPVLFNKPTIDQASGSLTDATTWFYTAAGIEQQIMTNSFNFTILPSNKVPTVDYSVRAVPTVRYGAKTCAAPAPFPTTTVTVKKTPQVGFDITQPATGALVGSVPMLSIPSILPDEALLLESTSDAGYAPANALTYIWSINNGSTLGTANVYDFNAPIPINPLGLGNKRTKLIVTNTQGCSAEIMQPIMIGNGMPVADFVIAPERCPNQPILFTNMSSNNSISNWYLNGASTVSSTATNPTFTFGSIGNHVITLSAENGSGDSDNMTETLTIADATTGFTVTNILNLRLGNTTIAQINNTAVANTVKWNFGDGSLIQNNDNTTLTHSYPPTPATYTIQQMVESTTQCKRTRDLVVTIHDYLPVADFLAPTEVCLNEEFEVQNLSTYDNLGTLVNFGDNPTNISFGATNKEKHTYSGNAPTYTIRLTARRNNTLEIPSLKTDIKSQVVTVKPLPDANFILQKSPIQLSFKPANTEPAILEILNNLADISSLTIDWQDGNITSQAIGLQQVHKHIYQPTAGETSHTYRIKVTLRHINGCQQSFERDIEVKNPLMDPIAKFEIVSNSKTNCGNILTLFDNQSENGYMYNWIIEQIKKFSEEDADVPPVLLQSFEASGKSLNHSFTQPGRYKVSLIALNGIGGMDKTEREIEIYPSVLAYFGLVTQFPKLARPVDFINYSQGIKKDRKGDFNWDFGDENQEKQEFKDFKENQVGITHRYKTPGTYTVKLEVKNEYGCFSEFQIAVDVGSIPNNTSETLIYPNVFRPVPSEGQITTGTALTQDQMALANLVFLPVSMVLAREIKTYNLYIYTRSGDLIFETQDINKGWDGTYKGKLLHQNVYIWHVDAELANGTKLKQAGDVLLLR